MKTFILIIVMAGQPDAEPRLLYTQQCGEDILALSAQMPNADFHCIPPSYKMRPVARIEPQS